MSRDNFPRVMVQIFRHEGGYVNHRRDPGGETKYGISKRSYPREDILNLTKARAQDIYRRDFWDRVCGDDLPAGIDLVAMDPAVNSGVSRGARWLQQGLGVKADGVIGPLTIKRAQQASPVPVIQRACAARMGFLRGLKTWSTFGKGWSRRVAEVEAEGVKMAVVARGAAVRPVADDLAVLARQSAKADAAKGGGAAVGGGSLTGLTDLPLWGIAIAVMLVVAIVVITMGQRRHNLARAEAYRNLREG